MGELGAWFRVATAVALFVVAALGASWLVTRVGSNIKSMESRTSTPVALIGLTVNLVVLGLVLAMLAVQPSASISSLGVGFSGRDLWALLAFAVVILVTILAFLVELDHRSTSRVRLVRLADGESHDLLGAISMVAVLVAVAAQEEVLFRGYIVVNLEHLGWVVAATVSVVAFVAVHVLTNAVTTAQMISWITGGALLVFVYLVSGSLWLAILVHLLMDLLNVVALGIAGSYSLVEIDPAPTPRWRAAFRIASSVLAALVLVGIYGVHVAAPLDQAVDPVPATGLISTGVPPTGVIW